MNEPRTTHAVWEVTLRCNLACQHCGSRAGPARPDELSTEEALDLVRQLAEVGIREVSLIGGEAFLRKDWLSIARAISDTGMIATMVTGGFGVTMRMARRMREAGIELVSVSIDGLEPTHDLLRGRQGSWRRCFQALAYLDAAGIAVAANTQLNRLSLPELPLLYRHLRRAGVKAWQVQLTGPMGNAADNAEILLQPSELLDAFPVLDRVARRAWADGVQFRPNNNVGYYGPYERMLRGNGHPWAFWQGPEDGLRTIGIESDGSVKADPTLPSDPYVGGNVRDRPLREIIERSPELTFNLGGGTEAARDQLWGFCRTCQFAEVCRGGAPWVAHTFFNRRGNNPYCHHRALVQEGLGLRERLVLTTPARGLPYDNGVFGIVQEPAGAPWPADDPMRFTAEKVRWPEDWSDVGEQALEADVGLSPVAVNRAQDPGVLPRKGWDNTFRFLQALLRVKAALDVAEADPVARRRDRR